VANQWDTNDGDRIARRLAAAGLSYRELEKRTGISTTTLQAWCKGRGNPTISKLRVLAQHIGCSAVDLIADPPIGTDRDAVIDALASTRGQLDHLAGLLGA